MRIKLFQLAAMPVFLSLLLVQISAADELKLTNGAVLQGRLIAEPKSSSEMVGLATEFGGRIWFPDSSVLGQRVDETWKTEYERVRPSFEDTVEGQMAAAAWCTERKLLDLAGVHLRRLVEIAPNHGPAWRALGYSQIRGEWIKRSDYLQNRGYTYYQGRWRLSQEIDRLENKEKSAAEQREWHLKIQRIVVGLRGDKRPETLAQLAAIRDPLAIGSILKVLPKERNARVRNLFVQTIAKIDHPEAVEALVHCSLKDGNEEVFLTCVEELLTRKRTDIVPKYVESLKEKNVVVVNRAAYMLGKLGDDSAILPLVDALFNPFIIPLKPVDMNNNMTASFVRDPPKTAPTASSDNSPLNDFVLSPLFTPQTAPALTVGDSPEFRIDWVPNEYVLRALTQLSGGYNFGFSPILWRNWYADLVRMREDGKIRSN